LPRKNESSGHFLLAQICFSGASGIAASRSQAPPAFEKALEGAT
jgi:hypothetical protein